MLNSMLLQVNLPEAGVSKNNMKPIDVVLWKLHKI